MAPHSSGAAHRRTARAWLPLYAALAGPAGCCCDGAELLEIWTTSETRASSAECSWGTIRWNDTVTVPSGTNVLVVYDAGDEDLVRTAIELYQEDVRLELPEDPAEEAACHNGCPTPRTLYTLPTTPGTYVLVHRERSGSGKPVWTPDNDGEPWTTWDGEPALVTNLVIQDGS